MHISEGVLAAPVLISGAAVTAAGCGIGLKKINYEKIPKVAVLSSAFFVASLIHIPLGPANVHLLMIGIIGIILGWASFPALLVALFLQTVLFQFGGFTTLGINTLNMALPALICFYLFSHLVRSKHYLLAIIGGFCAGSTAVLFAALLVAFSLMLTGESFTTVAKLIVLVHIPVMIVEGIITGFIVGFLRKTKPAILGGHYK